MSAFISARDLAKHYGNTGWGATGPVVRALDGVSFDIERRGALGLVGESGSGKSTAGRILLRLQEPTAGRFHFDGEDVFALRPNALRRLRTRMQIIHQNPMAAPHPAMSVLEQVRRPLVLQGIGRRASRTEAAIELLSQVGLSPEQARRKPHQFSGGQRQRISIARALITRPDFLVLDEPTSALDVSVQAQILRLLSGLRKEFGLTFLFVSHDLGVIRHMCDHVAVMYLGRLVEVAPKEAFFATPRHPYAQALLSVVPVPDPTQRNRPRARLTGEAPSPRNPPSGCAFHPRCPLAQDICRREVPALRVLATGHSAACHLAEPAP